MASPGVELGAISRGAARIPASRTSIGRSHPGIRRPPGRVCVCGRGRIVAAHRGACWAHGSPEVRGHAGGPRCGCGVADLHRAGRQLLLAGVRPCGLSSRSSRCRIIPGRWQQ
eukprot:4851980-Alexandrium_andersonii.AAC.1